MQGVAQHGTTSATKLEQMLFVFFFGFGLQILFSFVPGLRHAPAQVSKPQIISSQ